jgi:hypothetical protein
MVDWACMPSSSGEEKIKREFWWGNLIKAVTWNREEDGT